MAYQVIELNAGSGGQRVAVDRDTASPSKGDYQIQKMVFGGEGTFTHVTSTVGYPVNIVQNSLNSSTVATADSPVVYVTSMGLWNGSNHVRTPGDATNGVTVNLGANNDVTTELADAAALSDAFANPTTAPVGAFMMGWDANQSPQAWRKIQLNASGHTIVDLGSNNDVVLNAATSGGATPYRNIDVDESEDEVKASAGQIYWVSAMNMTASVLYLHFYNATAANVTVGTTTPTLTFPVPTLATTNGAGFKLPMPVGTAFSTAITIACTTDAAGTASPIAGPAANGCIVNMGYA